MNTKRNYYLFVPADDIYNKVVKEDGSVVINKNANEIFERNHVPRKYHHLIIKIPFNGVNEPKEAFELITKKLFYLKSSFIKALFSPLGNPAVEILSKDVGIVTENKIFTAYAIKTFYQEIIDNNLAGNYDNAVREILGKQKEETRKGLFTRIKKKK